MIQRNEDIKFKLLESEKARREQETDNQRKANSGEDKLHAVEKRYEEFIKKNNKGNEALRTIPPDFKLYYKQKAKEYFEKLNK